MPDELTCSSPGCVFGVKATQSSALTNLKSVAASTLSTGAARAASATRTGSRRGLVVMAGILGVGAAEAVATLQSPGNELAVNGGGRYSRWFHERKAKQWRLSISRWTGSMSSCT